MHLPALRASCVPDAHAFFHLILICNSVWGKYHHCCHLSDGETEARTGETTCSQLGSAPGPLSPPCHSRLTSRAQRGEGTSTRSHSSLRAETGTEHGMDPAGGWWDTPTFNENKSERCGDLLRSHSSWTRQQTRTGPRLGSFKSPCTFHPHRPQAAGPGVPRKQADTCGEAGPGSQRAESWMPRAGPQLWAGPPGRGERWSGASAPLLLLPGWGGLSLFLPSRDGFVSTCSSRCWG